ncbi:MAG: tetratricopeptide repeat protein [Nitrospira sp.]|nr:tetratricopeptide repeat protein [Nitrospira sp.]
MERPCVWAPHGFVKLLCRPHDGTPLGAQIVGPEAGELIHELIAVDVFSWHRTGPAAHSPLSSDARGDRDVSGGVHCRADGSSMKRTVAAGASALVLLVTLACGQQTWDAAMQAGETALQRGQYEQAEGFSAAVHKAEEFGLHDRRVAVTLAHLAQAYSAQGKFVEAEPVYLEALKIYQDVHGENHLDVAAMLNNLGVLHRKHGQYADAQRLLTRALDQRSSWERTIQRWRWP